MVDSCSAVSIIESFADIYSQSNKDLANDLSVSTLLPRDFVTPDSSLINNAKKPLIVWGQGVILGNAEDELIKFVEKSGIPAAWTILGASAIPTSHPLNVGMLGMHGNYAPNVLTNECDVLIAIGMRFDDRVTGDVNRYAKQAKIIHFEIDPAEVNKNIKVDVAVLGALLSSNIL